MRQIFTVTMVTLVTCGLLVLSGYLQGSWTGRWNPAADFAFAESRIAGTPAELGNWTELRQIEPTPRLLEMLQCRGYLHRQYFHKRTGDEVSLVLIAGPSGPTVAHIPEICYSSTDHTIVRERTARDLGDGVSAVWLTEFRGNNVDRHRFCVLYGWSTGEAWHASASPRFDFGGQKLVYKLQVASANAELGTQFLNAFLEYWRNSAGKNSLSQALSRS